MNAPVDIAQWGLGRRPLDPRWFQIAMLSTLLGYGVFGLRFGLTAGHIAAVLGAALATQWICSRLWRLPRFDPLSALISGIGLCTLLRTNGILPAALAAGLAISSKFVLRIRGKHLYNPTNLALVVMLLAGAGWISPGQYGHFAFAALRLTRRSRAVRISGGAGRRDRAVRDVPHQRSGVVAGGGHSVRAAHRPPVARLSLPMDIRRRHDAGESPCHGRRAPRRGRRHAGARTHLRRPP